VLCHAQRFGKIVSGSGGDDGERAVGAGFQQRVRDAAACPVSTDDGNRFPAGADRLEGDALFVAALTGLPDVADAKRGEGLRDFLQSSPRCAFSGGRVEDQPRDSCQGEADRCRA
jgi:hypothetical protein